MNDRRIFDILFRKHYNRLYLFAKQFLFDDEDCYDAVNDVFEEVWICFDQIDEQKALAFMFQCLRRKCIDRLRRMKVEKKYIQFAKILTDHVTTQEKVSEMMERELIVERVIKSLPPPTQYIFECCYVERMKYQEVADKLHISVSTVKKHIKKALKLIREQREFRDDENAVI